MIAPSVGYVYTVMEPLAAEVPCSEPGLHFSDVGLLLTDFTA
jgi:hypothetical protein